ncbi:MAG: tetratricopeptide repeat protein [Candidatus Riflebacteria bacterium]|nr:tetratricopeptide repeat protein [Candidatus Riflebacteria bacterium]
MAENWDWLKKVPGGPCKPGLPDVLPSNQFEPDAKAARARARIGSFLEPGDVVSRWRIERQLGRGGFGVVYLAHSLDFARKVALKTLLDEFQVDARHREAFKREALTWVNLDWHPFVLPATWVTQYRGRLFVETEYISPDESGRVTLLDWLTAGLGPLDPERTLVWGVQFCLGLEHAKIHGIRSHRDIKPGNILIGREGTVKVADFGLAAGIEKAREGEPPVLLVSGEGRLGCSVFLTKGRAVCGTPGYIAPEVLDGAEADERSDLYSFGVVLWQMASGSDVSPFVPRGCGRMGDRDAWVKALVEKVYPAQKSESVPCVGGPLGPIVKRCLRFHRQDRYGGFAELRGDLERELERLTGRRVSAPEQPKTADYWDRRGACLNGLGRREEAIVCLDKALEIDPWHVDAWHNKGRSLGGLGRHEEAIACYERALEICPRNVNTWNNKGLCLAALGRWEEAIACYDRALEIDLRNVLPWSHKGRALHELGRREEAIECYSRALEIDPWATVLWNNKGIILAELGRREEAVACYDKVLQIDAGDVVAWNNKGSSLDALGRREEAIGCYARALEIDPRYVVAWNNKGLSLAFLGRREEAIKCYDSALAIDPKYEIAWFNKGLSLDALGRTEEAIGCYDRALAIDPRDVEAWFAKAMNEDLLGRTDAAVQSYAKVIEFGGAGQTALSADARTRLEQLRRP